MLILQIKMVKSIEQLNVLTLQVNWLILSQGNNGMHHAAMNGKIEVMRFLLSNSINLETVNEEGKTPLHYACEKGDKESILFLVINKVNPEVKSKSG
jgi:ankyrin repeat protein